MHSDRAAPAGETRAARTPAAASLHRFVDPPLLGAAAIVAVVGFAQFSPAAVLADVAEHFGDVRPGDTIAEQAGLPGSVLGGGLAAIRFSALGALVLAGLADRYGRRRTLLSYMAVALSATATATAAASPGFWWFVALIALARPFLSATTTIGQVLAAEHTASAQRAKAIALMAAAYGVGAGTVALLRAALGGPGFRFVFALVLVPLAAPPLAARVVTEPARYTAFVETSVPAIPVLGASPTFTGALVVAAAPVGLGGLLAGRWLADRVGRRPTGAVALAALAGSGMLAYSGSRPALATGYLATVLFGAAYSTPAIALATELFPTSTRSSVAGWLLTAGVVGASTGLLVVGAWADHAGSFAVPITAVCVPAALTAILVVLVPETRGMELEQSAPEQP